VLELERAAARKALRAARLKAADVDLLIACSFVPESIGVGHAVHLARSLGLERAAWNLESACAGSLVALDVAAGLVQSGRTRTVLVVTSCNYSRTIDPESPLSWTAGDGAAAFVVGAVEPGFGLLGGHEVHTAETIETFEFTGTASARGEVKLHMRACARAGEIVRSTSLGFVRTCCRRAADAAGVRLDAIDLVVPNTPTAWFASFVARALGVARDRVVDGYPQFANIGPALWPVNLHLAATEGRLRPGALVLLYAIGSVSSSSAQILRWNAPPVVPRSSGNLGRTKNARRRAPSSLRHAR
jgi:3-oxoacyl-[acyl-carrier-protein] synthase-3